MLWGSCWELLARAPARNRANSFPDKPGGTGGATGVEPKDRRWRAIISPSGPSTVIKGCCSVRIEFLEPWIRFALEEYEFVSKGVTIPCGSAPRKLESAVEKDKMDRGLARLRLHRRCPKRAIPIRAKTAKAPPRVPPAIVAMFRLLREGGGVGPLAFIVCGGTLKKGS